MPAKEVRIKKIPGTATTTGAARPLKPAGPSASMTESIKQRPMLPKGSVPLPRKTFEDQRSVNSTYRWR